MDCHGNNAEKVAPFLNQSIYVQREDSFVAAFPSQKVQISYGIDFPQVGCCICYLLGVALCLHTVLIVFCFDLLCCILLFISIYFFLFFFFIREAQRLSRDPSKVPVCCFRFLL